MNWKLEDKGVYIDGGSIFRAFICIHVLVCIHKYITSAEQKYHNWQEYELKRMKKEEKLSKKRKK